MEKSKQKNIHGKPLELCSKDPLTGFFRNGCCDTANNDLGLHTVCVILTEEFLKFSLKVGNDLSTPRPEFQFVGLKPGDRWCLCATRFLEAYNDGCAPMVKLEATNEACLEVINMDILLACAIKEKA